MRIPRQALGMRWWLGLIFACVAALTAVAVVAVLNARSEHAFHKYAEAFAVGRSLIAAEALKHELTPPAIERSAAIFAEQRAVRLYVVDAHGRLISPAVSRGIAWSDVPDRRRAVATALAGNRYIRGRADGSEFVVGLPIHEGAGAAVVTFSKQEGLQAALGMVRDEFPQAALIALAVGAALGLVVATLIAHRLRRIATAAGSIGAGDFTARVDDRFPDEVGDLARSVERMRSQLQESFLALEGDRDRLEGLLDRLNDGVLVVDREFQVEFANDRARELLGGTDRLVEGEVEALISKLFETGLSARLRLVRGEEVLEVSGIPPVDSKAGAIVVVHDQSLEERNERVQREFATNAAHELRTPLTSIVTAVEMLQMGAKDSPLARDRFIDVIESEVARLSRLTRALLVLARADAREELPRLGRVAVAPVLEQVAASLRVQPGVDVSVRCPSTLEVTGDPDLLEQAISSVGSNAAEHTDAGTITMRGRAERGSVVIEIADTGCGIPSHEQRRIFDRFHRGSEREGGFGLGLSIAQKAVGALGGEIALDSRVDVGTTVRIVLPGPTGVEAWAEVKPPAIAGVRGGGGL